MPTSSGSLGDETFGTRVLECIAHFNKALFYRKKQADALGLRGMCYELRGNVAQGLRDITKAIAQ